MRRDGQQSVSEASLNGVGQFDQRAGWARLLHPFHDFSLLGEKNDLPTLDDFCDELDAESESLRVEVRERIIEHFSRTLEIPTAILRLNYAVAIRYGVLVDVARKVWEERPVALGMGAANVIWQADANAMALQAFDHVAVPSFVVNIAGPEQISIRRCAEQFGTIMGKTPLLQGEESPNALLSNGQTGHRLFGYPRISVQQMIHWIADWVMRGGEDLNKPTHFEVRDGKF